MRLRVIKSVVVAALPLVFGAVSAPAQVNSIGPNQTVNGGLDTSDGQLTDDSYFDLYEYRGQPGEEIVVTLRSSDFDAFLQGGPASGSDVEVEDTDDDSAGGTDARLSVTLGPSGVYRFRANSFEGGAYTLSLESESAAAGGVIVLGAGQTVSGRLDTSDAQLGDDSFFDLYEYRGQPGEAIVVTMRSPDFDAYLQGGPASGDDLNAEDSDDDGAGGTDSRMSVTLGSSGLYRIRANSLGAGQTGAYTLSLQSENAVSGGGSNVLGAGQTVAGRLDTSDPQLSDDSHYDSYYYEGVPGERLLITLTSTDFDTFLRWGQGEGAAFTAILTDDDGAGNTNSQLDVTLSEMGRYVIQANSFSGGETGSYTLSIEGLGGGTGGIQRSDLDRHSPVGSTIPMRCARTKRSTSFTSIRDRPASKSSSRCVLETSTPSSRSDTWSGIASSRTRATTTAEAGPTPNYSRPWGGMGHWRSSRTRMPWEGPASSP